MWGNHHSLPSRKIRKPFGKWSQGNQQVHIQPPSIISATLGRIPDFRNTEEKINNSKPATNKISEVAISSWLCPPESLTVSSTRGWWGVWGQGRLVKMTDADINDLICQCGVAASEHPIRQHSGTHSERAGWKALRMVRACGGNEDESRSMVLICLAWNGGFLFENMERKLMNKWAGSVNCTPVGAVVFKPHMPRGSEQIQERGEGLLRSKGVVSFANSRTLSRKGFGTSGRCAGVRQILDWILALPPASCGTWKIHAIFLNLSFPTQKWEKVGRKWWVGRLS